MSLNWRTLRSLPRLKNYHEAKAHHDNVTPIRGCKHKLRPVGRREQKWFHIWEDPADKAIHLGYGWSEEHREKLISFYKNGGISVWRSHGTIGASSNERCSHILGATFGTCQYATWVHTNYYVEGELKRGWLPLTSPTPKEGAANRWDCNPGESKFVRDGDGKLVFLNYKYPVTHKPNKAALAEYLEPLKPFIEKVENVIRLQGGRLEISNETRVELFGWSDIRDYGGNRIPNRPPPLRHVNGTVLAKNREMFFGWCKSGDPMDHIRAMAAIETNTQYDMVTDVRQWFIAELMTAHGKALLEATTHKDGGLVRDRYKRYLGNPHYV